MKKEKIGHVLIGSGATGFLIMGSGLDGKHWILTILLMIVFGAITYLGYRMIDLDKLKEESITVNQSKLIKRNREKVFRNWINDSGMDAIRTIDLDKIW